MKFYGNREQADATASFGSRLEFCSKSALKEIYYIFKGHGGEKKKSHNKSNFLCF